MAVARAWKSPVLWVVKKQLWVGHRRYMTLGAIYIATEKNALLLMYTSKIAVDCGGEGSLSARAGGGAWDRGRKVAMWMFAILFSVPVITNAAAQSCPPNQIASDAQIVLYSTDVLPASAIRVPTGDFDTNLTFFSDILGYNDDEIQH